MTSNSASQPIKIPEGCPSHHPNFARQPYYVVYIQYNLTSRETPPPTLTAPAKLALVTLALGAICLLGWMIVQFIVGFTPLSPSHGSFTTIDYKFLTRSAMVHAAAYVVVFASGLIFCRFGPYDLRRDEWFRIAFLAFYLWIPVDLYLILSNLQFVRSFTATTASEKIVRFLTARQQMLGPIPFVMLLAYVTALALIIFKPRFKTRYLSSTY